ncbi:aminoacyl-tRNA hydrolase [Candidatus Aerophobetes bacterium]|uniref:Peptidyl-tRNA hydrolase n=1 Tax=Aerophobetes bacterium TaxID=2030807 RepID=A0A2A4X638_UNCAE|nr:MAG: aminoacyl-tRNA hydrolase [Candidatus Aerophobetes bacterium]
MNSNQSPLLVVGLGNPGAKYVNTRHNIGFIVLEAWAEKLGASFAAKKQFLAQLATTTHQGVKVFLLKPETYMNLSGESVRKVVDYYKIDLSNILVVADDVYLPTGELRYRQKGSAAGHNGLKNIEKHLGTSEYSRLKVGIGSPFEEEDLADYVLRKFTQEEQEKIRATVHSGVDFLDQYLETGPRVNQIIKENYEHEG